MDIWKTSMENAENEYKNIIAFEGKPEEAREVLPNSTACKIIMKANLREWRHIFELRCSKAAYPQIRDLMNMMLEEAHTFYPEIFDDLYKNKNFNLLLSGLGINEYADSINNNTLFMDPKPSFVEIGNIKFENVSFSYPTNPNVNIKRSNISITMKSAFILLFR